MATILFYWAVFSAVSQFAILGLMAISLRRARKSRGDPSPIRDYPAISLITSLKGPTPAAAESVRSLLAQDYPGELELIFALKDEREPLLAEMRALVAGAASARQVHWVYPVDTQGLNPRTAKLAAAYQAASHPWIFVTCVDTVFEPGFLRESMEIAQADPETFVTTFPVIERMRSFAARLEGIGLNTDVAQFFLLSAWSARPVCAYGGALLFPRALLERVGGFGPFLPLLTDDVTLAQAFTRHGARGRVSGALARVPQPQHRLAEFWGRQIRWRMIGRYFLPRIFWLGPLAWGHVVVLAGAVVLGSAPLLLASLGYYAARVAFGFSVQALLGARATDRSAAWLLPVYDWIAIPAFFVSASRSSVVWGNTRMQLNRAGAVVGTRAVDTGLKRCALMNQPNILILT